MADVQVLRETENYITAKIVGTGTESNSVLIDASSYSGATGPVNLLSIEQLYWNCNADTLVTLIWEGASSVNIGKFSRNGAYDLKRNHYGTLENNAGTPSGDINITSTSGNYTLLMEMKKKGSGWTKIGQYGTD